MPKRPSDKSGVFADMSAERAQRKTERSHEENQERAYIAASRRADRSIEARVQSARMASEIHKKRTGKGFKISEEIVMKEEMYEEEDDDLPRQYRALAAHLHTSSPEMNNRLTAYLTNQVAMASFARQQEVNRLFAEQFPHASQLSQQLAQSIYYRPLQTNQSPSPASTQFSVNYAQSPTSPTFPRDRSQSVSQNTAMSPRQAHMSHHLQSPRSRHTSIDERTSPPVLTPGSAHTETPHPQRMSSFTSSYAFSPPPLNAVPVDPSLSMHSPPSSSVFTSELPHETKMMANFEMSDPMYNVFMGGMGGGELMGSDAYFNFMHTPTTSFDRKDQAMPSSEPQEFYGQTTSAAQPTTHFSAFTGEESRIGTPGGGDGDSWDAWVNNTDPEWVHLDSETHMS